MIECKHKSTIGMMNQGYTAEFCDLNCHPVNDIICRRCKLREGSIYSPPVETGFPRRNNNEMQAIQIVCASCPHFNKESQTCEKLCDEIIPVSIWSQNPAKHCPEGQW